MSANKKRQAEPPVRSCLAVRVQPGASRDAVVGRIGDEWKLAVTAPAIQGRANAACVELLAASLGLPRGAVRILGGASGRRKILEIEGLAGDEIERRSLSAAARGRETMDLAEIQEQLRSEGLDGWLFFDHHHRDPIAYRVLALDVSSHVTRRWYYFIPAEGEPRKLVHRIEDWILDPLPGEKQAYSSWNEQHEKLGQLLRGVSRVAMQHSWHCMIPYVSLVDGGTVDLIRNLGMEVVTSASLIQYFEARWSAEQLEMHREAGRRIDEIRRQAFARVGAKSASEGAVQEIEIADFIRDRFREQQLVTGDGPIVAVNANSSNPHYAPTAEQTSPIRAGDFVLIDLWAKLDQPRAVYYDITWTGFVGHHPPSEIQNVFEIVRGARDRAVEFVRAAVAEGKRICGYEVDDVARGRIGEKGLTGYFTHRTGHSIGEDVHGNGANIDNFETRDERPIIARTCFSVEPGIYLPGKFGVRSELDCYVSDADASPTGEVQRELVSITT